MPEYKDTSLNTEMEIMADLYNGRIVIVDKNYKIVVVRCLICQWGGST